MYGPRSDPLTDRWRLAGRVTRDHWTLVASRVASFRITGATIEDIQDPNVIYEIRHGLGAGTV